MWLSVALRRAVASRLRDPPRACAHRAAPACRFRRAACSRRVALVARVARRAVLRAWTALPRMAAPELLNVVALSTKVVDLALAGHMARSLEYSKRAIAAAQALGAEDCLIVAHLQRRHAQMLYNAAVECKTQNGGESQAMELLRSVTSLIIPAAETVQRRRAAGTLLPGACRDAEMMWYKLKHDHINAICGDPASAAGAASHCGYV